MSPEMAGIVGAIAGTVSGVILQFFLDQWRNRGKVTISPVEMYITYEGNGLGVPLEEARQVNFMFCLRVLNTLPMAQSLALIAVDFFEKKSDAKGKGKPLLSDPFLMIGTEFNDKGKDDIQIPGGNSFTKIHLSGAGISHPKDRDELKRHLTGFKMVRIRFLISPKKTVDFWHTFTPEEMGRLVNTTPEKLVIAET